MRDLEEDTVFFNHAMRTNIDEDFFINWTTAMHHFLMKHFDIKVQVLTQKLPGSTQLGQGESRLRTKGLCIKDCHQVFLVVDRPRFKLEILGVCAIS